MEEIYYVGVDVGTSSVRAALVDSKGNIITTSTHAITIWEPRDNFYEQSSDDIWQKCSSCVQDVVSGIDKNLVKGIGFDATCSLVALDEDYSPLTVCPEESNTWNIIMWMDHRAGEQADLINSMPHDVLRYVGGVISLEMQIPKLLWLKQKMKKECWDKAGYFFDLPDFLTWKATGAETRSLCSLGCKWTYKPDSKGSGSWDSDFFKQLNLADLTANNFKKIGSETRKPGEVCGGGLTAAAAADLGLCPGCPVATSIIDAHAGALGTLGCQAKVEELNLDLSEVKVDEKLALVCGTSTCHMKISQDPIFVPGVWGPYFSAILPGMWDNEGGQSAAGKLIDHIVNNHVAYPWIKEDAVKRNVHAFTVLNDALEFMAKRDGIGSLSKLTSDLHVWPDFHGNRSPLADSSLKGMTSGLTLASGAEDLALLYLATIQALAYGTKHIVDEMVKAGHKIKVIVACGGLSKNTLYLQSHADATGLPVVVPDTAESVLLGAAVLGACASANFSSLKDAMKRMGGSGTVVMPNTSDNEYHQRKYRVFLKMVDDQLQYRKIMSSQ